MYPACTCMVTNHIFCDYIVGCGPTENDLMPWPVSCQKPPLTPASSELMRSSFSSRGHRAEPETWSLPTWPVLPAGNVGRCALGCEESSQEECHPGGRHPSLPSRRSRLQRASQRLEAITMKEECWTSETWEGQGGEWTTLWLLWVGCEQRDGRSRAFLRWPLQCRVRWPGRESIAVHGFSGSR